MHNFRQVSPSEFSIFELAVFNGFLYMGGADFLRGYSVWKTDATGALPYEFIPIVTNGAGRRRKMVSVVSMRLFRGKLYVGSNGWLPRRFPPAELIRINRDDTWEIVVGKPRLTAQGFLRPLSGFWDSFGNPFNAHFWRMQAYQGVLYLGTNDSSVAFDETILDVFFNQEYGADLWRSEDGETWVRVFQDGFGNKFNFGIRTFASTPVGLFVGTATHVNGTGIWLGTAPEDRDGTRRRPPRRRRAKAASVRKICNECAR